MKRLSFLLFISILLLIPLIRADENSLDSGAGSYIQNGATAVDTSSGNTITKGSITRFLFLLYKNSLSEGSVNREAATGKFQRIFRILDITDYPNDKFLLDGIKIADLSSQLFERIKANLRKAEDNKIKAQALAASTDQSVVKMKASVAIKFLEDKDVILVDYKTLIIAQDNLCKHGCGNDGVGNYRTCASTYSSGYTCGNRYTNGIFASDAEINAKVVPICQKFNSLYQSTFDPKITYIEAKNDPQFNRGEATPAYISYCQGDEADKAIKIVLASAPPRMLEINNKINDYYDQINNIKSKENTLGKDEVNRQTTEVISEINKLKLELINVKKEAIDSENQQPSETNAGTTAQSQDSGQPGSNGKGSSSTKNAESKERVAKLLESLAPPADKNAPKAECKRAFACVGNLLYACKDGNKVLDKLLTDQYDCYASFNVYKTYCLNGIIKYEISEKCSERTPAEVCAKNGNGVPACVQDLSKYVPKACDDNIPCPVIHKKNDPNFEMELRCVPTFVDGKSLKVCRPVSSVFACKTDPDCSTLGRGFKCLAAVTTNKDKEVIADTNKYCAPVKAV